MEKKLMERGKKKKIAGGGPCQSSRRGKENSNSLRWKEVLRGQRKNGNSQKKPTTRTDGMREKKRRETV